MAFCYALINYDDNEAGDYLFQVFNKLSWFFKQHWKRYTFAIITLMTSSAIGLIPPKIIGFTIDHIQFNTLTEQLLTVIIIGFLILMIVYYTIGFLWDYTLFSGAVMLEQRYRSRLMNHFLIMSPVFFERFRTGDLMARSTNDLKAISLTAGFGILTFVDSSTFLFMIVAMMGFTINWQLTFAALIPLPIMGLLMNKYGAIIHQRFLKAQNAFGHLNDEVLESIQGIRVSRAFNQEKQEMNKFQQMTADVYEKNMAVARIDALFEPTMKILVGISYTIGLGYGAILVFQNVITLGDLVSFNVYLGMLIWPMFAVGELINILQRGNASLDRVHEILQTNPQIIDPKQPIEELSWQSLRFDKVDFTYPYSEIKRLKNISFKVNRGETIGVVGKTGSGKSTIAKLLLKQYVPDQGKILLGENDLQKIELARIRQLIGYVPQDQTLFSQTIRQNIQFGKSTATDAEIYKALDQAHFLQDIQQMPAGLDTIVGESGVTLSGGQQQRIALARAFIKQPEILILDDSLSAVDGKTEANIIQHIRKQRQQQTTIIIAHRLSAVKHAQTIIVLDEGKIAEQGTHDELMANKRWYYEQYTLQQLGAKEGDE